MEIDKEFKEMNELNEITDGVVENPENVKPVELPENTEVQTPSKNPSFGSNKICMCATCIYCPSK